MPKNDGKYRRAATEALESNIIAVRVREYGEASFTYRGEPRNFGHYSEYL